MERFCIVLDEADYFPVDDNATDNAAGLNANRKHSWDEEKRFFRVAEVEIVLENPSVGYARKKEEEQERDGEKRKRENKKETEEKKREEHMNAKRSMSY